MTAHKKKIVAFLVTVAFGSGALAVCLAQSTTAKPEKALSSNSFWLSENEPNLSAASVGNPDTQELFFKMMFSVLLVAALGIAVIYISKKFLPRITNPPGKKIRIIESTHIGPRKAVHLLKVGNQRLLIGSTNESITKLADVTDALADLSMQERDDNY